MMLGALAQGCAYGEDDNGNCLMGPPTPQQSCPFGTDANGNCISGPLPQGQAPVYAVANYSTPIGTNTSGTGTTTTSTTSSATAYLLIGGAILLAVMLK